MRPLLGGDVFSVRPGGSDDTVRTQPPPMTYFIADEKTIEGSSEGSSISHSMAQSKNKELIRQGNYEVERFELMASSLADDADDSNERSRDMWPCRKTLEPTSTGFEEDQIEKVSHLNISADASRNVSPSRPSQSSISRPYTPLSFRSAAPASLSSTPDSRVNSITGYCLDDIASQSISPGRSEEQGISFQLSEVGSVPQLVMPSIKMPSRRPFTEKGRNMGRMKLISADIGKTSLIKSIVHVCEDIVHVDSICITGQKNQHGNRKGSSRARVKDEVLDFQPTSKITEIYASTKPYPAWWSDLEESKVLRRRRSLGDTVLQRNLCFVDTPGYSHKTSHAECISSVVEYVESQCQKVSNFDCLSESEAINMLTGNGGTQVDVVLYMITNRLRPIDVEFIRRLSRLTNIIPLIAQADLHTENQLLSIKENLLQELQSANIRPFHFGPSDELNFGMVRGSSQPSIPFVISNILSKDLETMDASLLMSPDYVQPLIESELKNLVTQMFERDAIAWLRYSAAKKIINWRASSNLISLSDSLFQPVPILSTSRIFNPPVGTTNIASHNRILDHTQREERIARVRLANWAANLQRSLQSERTRFESLARSERAVWLTQRLSECVHDGTIVPISQVRKDVLKFGLEKNDNFKTGSYSRRHFNAEEINKDDPLGLLLLNHEMRRRGWILFKTVSSLGIISGLAFCAVRAWHENWQICGLGSRDWIGLGVLYWC
ncbi:hypothetical protein K3495_g13842 [Podosphaera aphanis]|nr:hypothetical protein K3495_g13842 [Podosphaera aphanis]